MHISVFGWASRVLHGVPRYRDCREHPELCATYSEWVPEAIIGVYENPEGALPRAIVVTESGLWWRSSEGVQRVAFAQLRAVHGPADKAAGAEVRMDLVDGSIRTISIEGADGRFRDVYEVVRFLARVLNDR